MEQEEMKKMSVFDVFGEVQETLEEAKKKSSEESNKRVDYLRMDKDGTYVLRVLPLAPVLDADGKPLPMERKGYEYPIRTQFLKINVTDAKGKQNVRNIPVVHTKYCFPKITADLIDTYVKIACEKYADDAALCKKIKSNGFEGGLKYNSARCMYVIDTEKRSDGIQLLQLSYAQYKELDDRKLDTWNKLSKKGNVPCPISSISNAYPVEIKRTTENKKVSYSFNVDTLSDLDVLSEQELNALLDMPRIPESIYRYTRFHLEATIEYLNQCDEKFDIEVMGCEEINDVIDQIKMSLPADDQSHFSTDGSASSSNSASTPADKLDEMFAKYDAMQEEGLDDKSDEGAELRAEIKEFIDDNDLNIPVTRKTTNIDLLNEIDKVLNSDEPEDEEKPAPKKSEKSPKPAPEPEPEDEPEDEDEEDDEPAAPAPAPSRRERNDDTNEPAVRSDRRATRVPRRR